MRRSLSMSCTVQLLLRVLTWPVRLGGEAAKVIENTQRDLNIAIINEFAKIFNILGIDTQGVLDAAGTKWNFYRLSPAWSVAIALVSIPTT